jgi:hypothetical protein
MEERNVNLSRETLQLTSCGECLALLLREHWERHVAWHLRLKEGE